MWGIEDAITSIEIVRHFLLWCAVINCGLLLVWAMLLMRPRDWLYWLWRGRLRLSAEQFEAIIFAGMVLFKMGILLFNLVPFIALCIVG